MKNLKKLVSVVLSLAMVISAMTFTASAKTYGDVETSSKYFEAIDILSSLGILQGDEQGNFNGDAEIKRSEFAAVVCRAMGQENAAKGSASEQRFTDVASNHWAAGYINWAAGQKIVNGKGDGIFDPDAPVKYEEAVKMLVSALGYEPLATRKGGYPTGYMVVAASNGINSGVSLAGSANAPRNIVAQLTYNALDVPLMDSSYVTKNGQDEYNIYDGTDYARRTLLSYYLDITKVKAVVDATSTSLESLAKKNGENQVRLVLKNAYKFEWEDILDGSYEKDDRFTLLTGDVNATDYIGYTVIAYVGENENDEYVLSAMTVDAKSVDTLEVTSNFETAIYDDGGKTTFEYYENENDLKTQSVDLSYKPTVYVNGRVAADEEEAFNAIPDNARKRYKLLSSGANGLFPRHVLFHQKRQQHIHKYSEPALQTPALRRQRCYRVHRRIKTVKKPRRVFRRVRRKINRIHFPRRRVRRGKYFSLRECRAQRGAGLSAIFFVKEPLVLWQDERRTAA